MMADSRVPGFGGSLRRLAGSALAAIALLPASAAAFTPAEIDAAATVAHEVEADVLWLADDALAGRGSGTAEGALAAELLIDELLAIGPGLGPGAGRDAYRQVFDEVRANLFAVIPGGARASEYVMIGAHYDHLPPDRCSGTDLVCNGATDNAAGVAVVLAIGRAIAALPEPPERSIVLALWDGEELGLLGSKHFVDAPLVPLADVVAYVNFDIQGSNLAPSARDKSFAIGAETGGELLTTLTEEAIAAVGLDTRRLSFTFGQGRSDYAPIRTGKIPIVFFSDATNACYHTSDDEIEIVDFNKLERQAEIGFRLALALAQEEERPVLTPTMALDTYEDLVALSDLLTAVLADLDVVFPSYQDDLLDLEAEARAKVAAGPEAFGPTDALLVAQSALGIATEGLPCDPLVVPEPDAARFAALVTLVFAARASRPRRRRAAPS